MPRYLNGLQRLVRLREFLLQGTSGVETVDQQRLSSESIVGGLRVGRGLVREQMECLETGRLAEVGCVCVGWEGEVRVGGVGQGEVGDEVVETSVVSCPDRADLSKQLFGSFGGRGSVGYKGESMHPLGDVSLTSCSLRVLNSIDLTIFFVSSPMPCSSDSLMTASKETSGGEFSMLEPQSFRGLYHQSDKLRSRAGGWEDVLVLTELISISSLERTIQP